MITPGELVPQPHELVLRSGPPDSIEGWKALACGLLTDQSCAFHRNLEISSRYAWLYAFLPASFKWAGMAAFASHHVRIALFPLRPFYLYSLTRGIPQILQAHTWPRITR